MRAVTCLIICECGDCLQADSPDELVAAMQRHLDAAHPEIAGAPLPGDLLALVEFYD
jgi:predicted small metal-binding protein